MNKKILTAAIALSITATAALAQTKQLSAPTKTENTTTTPAPTTSPGLNSTTKPAPTTPQVVTPPDAVASKFKTMYPSVQGVNWMMGKQGNYAAMFKNNGTECRTVYTPAGVVIREVTVVQKTALPKSVIASLDKNSADKTPKRCEEIKNAKGKTIYVIKYDDKVVRLDADGNEVNQVDETDKDQ